MNLLHYGLQRSGTNFLQTVLKKKYCVRFMNRNKDRSSPLQKHFRLYDEKDIIPEPQFRNEIKIPTFNEFEQLLEVASDYYLVISKDPYSWLLSYKKWAKKRNWPSVTYHYIMEYNLFYGKWLEFSQQTEKILFVRYIDLLQDADEELKRLESKMHLKKRFLSPLLSSVVNKVSQSGKFSNDKRSYYLSEQYLKSYTEEDLKEINDLIDPEVITLLGYQKKGNEQ